MIHLFKIQTTPILKFTKLKWIQNIGIVLSLRKFLNTLRQINDNLYLPLYRYALDYRSQSLDGFHFFSMPVREDYIQLQIINVSFLDGR